ncbi:MAG: class I SAM-dependent methyltransferase [Flavobacteriales bacterium]|nr:class I SAM-dependent methyltransferase [Flavobacteriia bacterium]NCP06692.1 class I SAM-dependent methyltransferase [Flavobacteriales bacterium]PJB18115.1 MAG: SAM-dependent methyltransferase [Flavobacteriaceae bacterium CG_4_9_14_3_um_filter_33_16]NCP60665.1 class I SAM-dependent methyltransferase [Flavobacteriales bacterium]NCP90025.1 class I SAM-dependent methyltransferase [Flavobacteriales bacterium]
MNKAVLNKDVQEFINNHMDSDVSAMIFKGTRFPKVETKEIIEQIEAKKKCRTKLPTWFQTENIYYPNKLNIEQTSSEITASYKSKLISGASLIDLTGGFGVDCFYFSKAFKKVVHFELNPQLSALAEYNFKVLGIDTIETKNIDGIEYLINTKTHFDWIYIDPSRRHDNKGKVFFLNDCLPNVPEHLETIFNATNQVMVKTSPLLDLTMGIHELKFVKSIYIVAVNNEVKELLWILEKNHHHSPTIKTVNLTKESTITFDFVLEDEKTQEPLYSKPLAYLYEPNAAIMKAGAFNSISNQFKVKKLQKHSHLYTSNKLIDFPGRIFKIEQILPYHIKSLKKIHLKNGNISTRNFPESVQQIRKKLNLKDGGEHYLFFTTDIDLKKIVIISSKN